MTSPEDLYFSKSLIFFSDFRRVLLIIFSVCVGQKTILGVNSFLLLYGSWGLYSMMVKLQVPSLAESFIQPRRLLLKDSSCAVFASVTRQILSFFF